MSAEEQLQKIVRQNETLLKGIDSLIRMVLIILVLFSIWFAYQVISICLTMLR